MTLDPGCLGMGMSVSGACVPGERHPEASQRCTARPRAPGGGSQEILVIETGPEVTTWSQLPCPPAECPMGAQGSQVQP